MAAADDIEIIRHVAATPEQVWPYLTDGALWSRWQGRQATVEPAPGGTYRMLMADGSEASGRVVEVVPHRRITFTWGWTGAPFELEPGSTTVEISLEPVDNGTLIRLRHRDLPEHLREPHGAGWTHYLARLDTLLQGGDPGPDAGAA
jgi:uncharacterized protein YndB with AHSA1/START domain